MEVRAPRFEFEPGESSFVSHQGFRINAERLRVWAKTPDGALVWTRDRDRDVMLVDEDGYEYYHIKVTDCTFD